MYACSILYRCRLPLVCALNKSDLGESERVRGWMEDFDSFQLAVEQETSYMGSLVLSMGLALEEFYNILEVAECSAVTGYGMDDLLVAIDEAEDIDKVEVDDATHSAQSDSNSADDTKATALSDTNDSESLEKFAPILYSTSLCLEREKQMTWVDSCVTWLWTRRLKLK